MSTATTTALRVEPGFAFPAETIVVDATEQRRLHGHCDIPPERYGDYCDIGLLARRTITLNTAAIQKRRVMSVSSGFGPSSCVTVSGSSAMPHFGQEPGPFWRTSGCMGQV